VVALSPAMVAGSGWEAHCEGFFGRLEGMEGVRLPGSRRYKNRLSDAPREINSELLGKIRSLMEG